MISGTVLVLGANKRLSDELARLIPDARFRTAAEAVDTEGLGIDVVVIAGDHPLEELTQVRVHPRLYETPVVLFAPGHRFSEEWQALAVWPVTTRGLDAVYDLTDQIVSLLTQVHHHSMVAP